MISKFQDMVSKIMGLTDISSQRSNRAAGRPVAVDVLDQEVVRSALRDIPMLASSYIPIMTAQRSITLVVTHSSPLVTSTSWTQMLVPEISIPSRPPMKGPRRTRLYASAFVPASMTR